MRNTPGFSTAVAVLLSLLSGGRSAWAQAHPPLEYKCGPVLEKFTIYPLYYGIWTPAQIASQQAYLNGLAGYISGVGAPKGEVPVLRQYGVNSASVALRPVIANPKAVKALSEQEIVNIINTHAAELPFGRNNLIMVFLGKGSSLTACGACGYHRSASPTSYWGTVQPSAGPSLALVTAHEVFEAATDPAYNNGAKGWISANKEEAIDGCNSPKFPFINLPFGQIPSAADNTKNGTCSTTGYIRAPEKFNRISFNIHTGADDLRGDSSATASMCYPGGAHLFTLKAQSDPGWPDNSDTVKEFAVPGPPVPLSFFGSITITLTSHNSFPETNDNWNLQRVGVTAKGPAGSACVLDQNGNPLSRLTGDIPSVTLYRRKSC